MNKLNKEEKIQALENALQHYSFSKKFFIQSANTGRDSIFAIASKSESGGVNTHTRFMSYDEFNSYLIGYYDAKMKKF